MPHRQQKYILFLATLLTLLLPSQSSLAQTVADITLKNGAKVRLNDDFTWEYVILKTPENPKKTTIATSKESVPPTLATTPQLNEYTLNQSELLKSTTKEGVNVSILNTQWKKDQLGVQFELTSNSDKHYVLVALEVRIFNDNGTLIQTDEFNVWQATFRLPETYLRRNETRKSRVFWINGINKAQWTKQLMSLKITELTSR